jgi:DNA-binding NtrC family response regulator
MNDTRWICLSFPLGSTLREIKKAVILDALGKCRGNRELAAEALGCSLSTIARYARLPNDSGLGSRKSVTVGGGAGRP